MNKHVLHERCAPWQWVKTGGPTVFPTENEQNGRHTKEVNHPSGVRVWIHSRHLHGGRLIDQRFQTTPFIWDSNAIPLPKLGPLGGALQSLKAKESLAVQT